ncbi:MAG: protein-tyrosine-phosphatase, partial [Flammeovirgaceae bacterium]
MSFYVSDFIKIALNQKISSSRKELLSQIIEYIKSKIENKQEINLNFICTHNSRRSQLSQVWAKVASVYYGIEMNSYSGGVEVTYFNERAIDSLVRSGFSILFENSINPKYEIS